MPVGVHHFSGRTISLLKTSFLRHCTWTRFYKAAAAMSSSALCAPLVVVHSAFTDGPNGIQQHMKKSCEALYKQCRFIACDVPLSEESLETFRKAEVILMDTERLPALMNQLENVKWVQSTWAGVDGFINFIDPALLPPKFTLTRFAGVFGPHMAEYVIGHILAHERRFAFLREAQQNKEWALAKYTTKSYRLLKDQTIVILGSGDIGSEIGRVCKAFNMRVLGLVRRQLPAEKRCSAFDEFRTSSDLPYLLGEADFIVNVLPSTEQTIDFLSGDALSHCKKKPVFINVGRGDVISEESIIAAISEGWISHAILDVTRKEPLVKESPLWSMPEVTITPHVSAQSHGPEIAKVFYENYQRYIKGEIVKYQLDWQAKY